MTIRFLPEARDELVEAAKFYENRKDGLGDRFRRRILRRFPFSVIYAHEQDTIVVVAVAHTSRKPGYWRGRTDD